MSIQVTFQRERELQVSADDGLAVIDRWHLEIEQPRRRTPLRLVRSSLLEAYNIGREICRANGLPIDWKPTILPPIVRVSTGDAARRNPASASKPASPRKPRDRAPAHDAAVEPPVREMPKAAPAWGGLMAIK